MNEISNQMAEGIAKLEELKQDKKEADNRGLKEITFQTPEVTDQSGTGWTEPVVM